MPTDMSKYPANWEEIRAKILRRSGGREPDPRIGARCEICNLANYAVGYRDSVGTFHHVGHEIELRDDYRDSYESSRYIADCFNESSHEMTRGKRAIVIVLTIAHIDNPDPMDCRPENLKALCQKCHNDHDSEMRARNRKISARQKEIERGQLTLPI